MHPILKRALLALLLLVPPAARAAPAIIGPSTLGPKHVAVVFNKAVPESREVAVAYARARRIPSSQVIGLECPTAETITRKEFRDTILEPLRRAFAERDWWQLTRASDGVKAVDPVIRVIALMHGMPLRISRDATVAEGKLDQAAINEASVDSELALLGVFNTPIDSAVNNPYFRKMEDFARFKESSMMLVSRIDGPDVKCAVRLATEAVEIEEAGGPWGRAVIDLYGKGGGYQVGDDWLLNVFNDCWDAGIPAQVDRHPWTLTDFYPLNDCAVYFGWYEGQRNGFMLDPEFRFRPGAVAVHLHSFSAQSLRDPEAFWAGPLVARGATATLGNVWEPYLQMSHHFDIFNSALLQGYTLAEAAGMSIPVLSWMNITVGDPLYRPFVSRRVLNSDTIKPGPDSSWMAVRVALARWQSEPEECAAKLRAAAAKTNDPVLAESAGLLEYRENQMERALADFQAAAGMYKEKSDQLRCQMLVAECLLAGKQKVRALANLRDAEKHFTDTPQVRAVAQLILKLDPPPPPPPPATPPGAAGEAKPATTTKPGLNSKPEPVTR